MGAPGAPDALMGARVLVSGRVQGVGYRAFARSEAEAMGVRGWVRNEPDGTVRVEAVGDRSRLDRYIERLSQGPSGGRVERVDVQWQVPEAGVREFTIRW